MSASGDDWLSRAEGLSPAEAVERGLSGIILMIFGVAVSVGSAFGDGIIDLIGVFGSAREFFQSLIADGPILVLTAGARQSALALRTTWDFLGPFALPIAVVMIALSWMIWTRLDPEIPFVDEWLPWR